MHKTFQQVALPTCVHEYIKCPLLTEASQIQCEELGSQTLRMVGLCE